LIAMGAANVATIFTGGLVTTTSVSRSAANYAAGANTPLSSVIAAVLVCIIVMFFTPLFYYLPSAALAAVVVMSVANLLSLTDYSYFRRYSRGEPIPYVATFLGVMFIDIETGILMGIAASVAIYLYRTLRPPIIRLGRIAHTEEYGGYRTFAKEIQPIPGVLIIRIDDSLYFANVSYLANVLRNRIAEFPEAKYLILVCHPINTIDASAIESLIDLIDEFKELGVEIYFAEMKDRLKEKLSRVNFAERVGTHRFFESTHEAVKATGQLRDESLLPI
jgi:sulfate permease, SulP family